MGYSDFPNGITSFGIPITNSGNASPWGTRYFLDSATGSDLPNYGTETSKPFATLDYALGKCSENKGDEIHIAPNHSETITGVGGITFDKAGVKVIGHGCYDQRPRFLMDGAATVSCLVTSADVWVENCVFAAGHADINYFALITAKGFHFINCVCEENVATENFKIGLNVSAADNDADGLTVIGCDFNMPDTANLHAVILNKDSVDVKLISNRVIGDFGNTPYAPIYSASTEAHTNIHVVGNFIHNLHNDNAAVGISIANTSSTGFIVKNHVGHQDTAGETPILAGAAGLYCGENYASGVLGTASGYLYPAADS